MYVYSPSVVCLMLCVLFNCHRNSKAASNRSHRMQIHLFIHEKIRYIIIETDIGGKSAYFLLACMLEPLRVCLVPIVPLPSSLYPISLTHRAHRLNYVRNNLFSSEMELNEVSELISLALGEQKIQCGHFHRIKRITSDHHCVRCVDSVTLANANKLTGYSQCVRVPFGVLFIM